jgi:hypothetical protein
MRRRGKRRKRFGSGYKKDGRGGLEGESVHGDDVAMGESAAELYF